MEIINELTTIIKTASALADELSRIKSLFSDMDKAYGKIAGHYGFECNGCKNNCCLTRFYHHTAIETAFLYRGFTAFEKKRRRDIALRARQVIEDTTALENAGKSIRIMCPLNEDGRCILYRWRPMICRLHGIPHELKKPGGTSVRGPGCEEFDRQCGRRPYAAFDRTPFYIELAGLEQNARKKLPAIGKIKLTVAEMIAGFEQVGSL